MEMLNLYYKNVKNINQIIKNYELEKITVYKIDETRQYEIIGVNTQK